ncbi:Transcription factor CBF/NF-Y/archaeal histone domain-containing protein [Dioscorea alata]|uniref:Transcription factor CBF/NF-Y/archaeal histone domain-containing protein n=1 Tax=Dioscorea alata TaxID=55571 RepID=A0ACB7WTS8_DIOAL|nr:Transcription factor CBF/NF-Y/archaeal histone domain-containing protein [Dioscorea alata]
MKQPGTFSILLSSGISSRTNRHSLPLARIKKIMKFGEDVKMIFGEAPVIIYKACELFIEELIVRSWMVTLKNKRRTLHKKDITTAVKAIDIFDFLMGMVSETEGHLSVIESYDPMTFETLH